MTDYSSLIPWTPVSLPDEQQRRASDELNLRLNDLAHYVEDFEAAIQLFEYARPLARDSEQHRKWKMIAARDGAITLFNFHKALQTLGQLLRNCAALWAHAPKRKFKDARNLFDSAFTSVGDSRHGVAHNAEFAHKRDDHAVKGSIDIAGALVRPPSNVTAVYVSGSLFNDQYAATVNGKLVSYHINTASLGSLVATLEAACSTVRTAKEGFATESTPPSVT